MSFAAFFTALVRTRPCVRAGEGANSQKKTHDPLHNACTTQCTTCQTPNSRLSPNDAQGKKNSAALLCARHQRRRSSIGMHDVSGTRGRGADAVPRRAGCWVRDGNAFHRLLQRQTSAATERRHLRPSLGHANAQRAHSGAARRRKKAPKARHEPRQLDVSRRRITMVSLRCCDRNPHTRTRLGLADGPTGFGRTCRYSSNSTGPERVSWREGRFSPIASRMSGPYVGATISLVSKAEVRYVGVLHSIDPVKATVALSNGMPNTWTRQRSARLG